MRLTTQVCPASFTLASPAGAIYAAKPTSICLYVAVNNQRNFSLCLIPTGAEFDRRVSAPPRHGPARPDHRHQHVPRQMARTSRAMTRGQRSDSTLVGMRERFTPDVAALMRVNLRQSRSIGVYRMIGTSGLTTAQARDILRRDGPN